jgi:hypothetical protein
MVISHRLQLFRVLIVIPLIDCEGKRLSRSGVKMKALFIRQPLQAPPSKVWSLDCYLLHFMISIQAVSNISKWRHYPMEIGLEPDHLSSSKIFRIYFICPYISTFFNEFRDRAEGLNKFIRPLITNIIGAGPAQGRDPVSSKMMRRMSGIMLEYVLV